MKLKTRASAKKRVRVTATGKMLFDKANKRHRLVSKSAKAKGRNKYGALVPAANTGMLAKFMPHSI
ncbi:MAG TPA: bL35 family ribosomal protein [bacterium]|nr:bL35 family ribosomal protein [bacterium]